MGKLITYALKALTTLVKRKPPPISGKVKTKFPKQKPSKSTCVECVKRNPYFRLTRDQLLKSKAKYEKLIAEHEKKLADYKANPFRHDNLGILKNARPDIQQKIIQGRIKSIEGQLTKQRNELQKVLEALTDLPPL